MAELTKEQLNEYIVNVLKSVYDPEIPVDIYEMGLIYEINIDDNRNVNLIMTLTSPNCPVAESLPAEVKQKVEGIQQVNDVTLDLVWEPTWDKEMMSDVARVELGMY